MNAKRFRKTFLPGVIFLFFVLVLGQSAWSCDEDGYPDNQCYEQLDIKYANVDIDGYSIYIWGDNFNNGAKPVVTLGGYPVDVNLWNREWIEGTFQWYFQPGHYKLVVSTGDGHKCRDKHNVTIRHHEKPPCEPPPPTCTCPPEACTYTCPQATFTSTTITKELLVDANETISGSGYLFQDKTEDCPLGTKLTGGGFEVLSTDKTTLNLLTALSILASRPSDTGNGWFVRGIITKVEITSGDNFILKIDAVCGKVEQ